MTKETFEKAKGILSKIEEYETTLRDMQVSTRIHLSGTHSGVWASQRERLYKETISLIEQELRELKKELEEL